MIARGAWPLCVGLAVSLGPWAEPVAARDGAPRRCVQVAEVDGLIGPAAADYLDDAVTAAADAGCEALLVRMDTPGGMLDPTRAIVQTFLNAPLPVVVYVAPSGARAGSAGMFITMAAHVAAMAPGSNIGAAHPVMAGGQEVDPELKRKLANDTAALARAIATRRGRNVGWAERAVRESVSATAGEAAELGVIDVVATSRAALLSQLNGMQVELDGRRVELAWDDVALRPTEMSIQQRVLSLLNDPNVVSLLFMVGVLGLMIELYSPGGFVAGGLGLVALLLAAVGSDMLPVRIAGVGLIVLAAILFAAEIFVTSFGLLALAGLGALLLGVALLMDRTDPNFFADASVDVSWGLLLPTALVIALAAAALAWRAGRLRRRPVFGGQELEQATGTALTDIDRQGGQVRVRGETWQARSQAPVPAGASVRVVRRDGLTLQVTAAPPQASTRASRQPRV